MFNVGGGEVLVILLLALIVLGPDKLPNAARQAGKYLGDFRRMSNGFQRELRDAMDLGDLTDLVGGTKPTSAGGPTPQPSAPRVATAPPGESGAPASPAGTPSTNGSDPSAGSPNATTTSKATTATTPTTATSGTATTPTVRKRSIEVDGPSSSFG